MFKITGAAGCNILYKLERVELFELPGGGGETFRSCFKKFLDSSKVT